MRNNNNKCGRCKKRLILYKIQCKNCQTFFHKKCEPNLCYNKDYVCTPCLNKSLPFFKLQNLAFIDNCTTKDRLEKCPSFKIQSLLDEMKRNRN